MRRSKALEKMRRGEPVVSIKLNLTDIRGVEIAAMCGFDCIWVDLEHCPNGIDFLENAIRAAKIYDCDILTRVEKGGYNDYIKPLEADSTGIMVPHLMSLKEAKEIVYFTKFHPIGRRPIDAGNADGAYCLEDGKTYMETANRERFVVVQIEDPEPLSELDEICALDGIDMIFFGPADFSQGIGAPLDFSNPEIDRVRRLIPKVAKKYGKFAGTVGSPDNIGDLVKMGYDYINVGADVLALSNSYKQYLAKCKDNLK